MSPERFEKPIDQPIEQQANFEGNWSEVLFERINNPEIRNQLIDLSYQSELAEAEYYRTEPFEFAFEFKNGDRYLRDTKGALVSEEGVKSFQPRSREDISKKLDEDLKKVMTITPIKFSKSSSTIDAMSLYFKNPYTGESLNDKQQSMVEAHEKGHHLREYGSGFFGKYFSPGFDQYRVVLTDEEIESWVKSGNEDKEDQEIKNPTQNQDEIRASLLAYLFNGSEIAERMAQLKNYFGMRDSKQVTKEHLEYARQHYLVDVGFDNYMRPFFQAITPETENEFLRLINNSGI